MSSTIHCHYTVIGGHGQGAGGHRLQVPTRRSSNENFDIEWTVGRQELLRQLRDAPPHWLEAQSLGFPSYPDIEAGISDR